MMKTPMKLLSLCVLLFTQLASAQSVFGKWRTIDDRTGKPKAVIHVFKKNGMMYGEIEKILEEGKEDAVCVKCDGAQKDQPVVGMRIIDGLTMNDDNEWKGKYLFDPEQAMTFRCKIWLNPENSDELKVRGYLAFLYRTQTWLREVE